MSDIVSTTALRKEFRGFAAVRDVDLRVAEGSVHALVGPNGAGKTTLFNMLTGFLTPSAGRIEIAGKDVTGEPPERIATLAVARSFQIPPLFPALTARDHVELSAHSRLLDRLQQASDDAHALCRRAIDVVFAEIAIQRVTIPRNTGNLRDASIVRVQHAPADWPGSQLAIGEREDRSAPEVAEPSQRIAAI